MQLYVPLLGSTHISLNSPAAECHAAEVSQVPFPTEVRFPAALKGSDQMVVRNGSIEGSIASVDVSCFAGSMSGIMFDDMSLDTSLPADFASEDLW
jgi:hypothetical protein